MTDQPPRLTRERLAAIRRRCDAIAGRLDRYDVLARDWDKLGMEDRHIIVLASKQAVADLLASKQAVADLDAVLAELDRLTADLLWERAKSKYLDAALSDDAAEAGGAT